MASQYNYAKINLMPKNRGFGLLEIVIASAIIAGTIFSLAFVFLISHKLANESSNEIRANFLAEEGLEALRFLRDRSWSANLASLNTSTTYYLSFNSSNSSWSIGTSNPGTIDNLFTRSFTVENVNRNASDNIVPTGGSNDPDTRKFNVTISWTERGGAALSTTVSTYLTDIFDN